MPGQNTPDAYNYNIFLATQNPGKRRELETMLANLNKLKKPDKPLPIRFLCAKNIFDFDSGIFDIQESGESFAENARIKALGYAQALTRLYQQGAVGKNDAQAIDFVLAEDSGLEVMGLSGTSGLACFPGVYSRRWLNRDAALQESIFGESDLASLNGQPVEYGQSELNQAILKLMRKQENRQAAYHCAMALLDLRAGRQNAIVETYGEMALHVAHNAQGNGGFGYDPIMHPVDSSGHPMALSVAQLDAEAKNRLSHRGEAFGKLIESLAELCQPRR